jgi:hypothetical protein
MNMPSYMLEFTAKDCCRGAEAGRRNTRTPENTASRTPRGTVFF